MPAVISGLHIPIIIKLTTKTIRTNMANKIENDYEELSKLIVLKIASYNNKKELIALLDALKSLLTFTLKMIRRRK